MDFAHKFQAGLAVKQALSLANKCVVMIWSLVMKLVRILLKMVVLVIACKKMVGLVVKQALSLANKCVVMI